MNNGIFDLKKGKNKKLKKEFGLPENFTPLGLIKLRNKDLIRELRDGLLTLNGCFIIEVEGIESGLEKLGNNIIAVSKIDKADLAGFDFVLLDECRVNIDDYIKNGVTPIVKNDCHLSSILKQFNPLKNEGNSFLYDNFNKWSIFAGIIKYNENFKFPFDNKNLVKNVVNL